MEGEFSGGSTDLILEEAWDEFRAQFDICSTVTALFIVVRCRENSDNLGKKEKILGLKIYSMSLKTP